MVGGDFRPQGQPQSLEEIVARVRKRWQGIQGGHFRGPDCHSRGPDISLDNVLHGPAGRDGNRAAFREGCANGGARPAFQAALESVEKGLFDHFFFDAVSFQR
jgi:hypothetical protein